MKQEIKEILTTFFEQSETNDLTKHRYPNSYSDLDLQVGFGIGVKAEISWIVFLGPKQTPQEGIYPVLYYYRKHRKLILAYGISETHRPLKSWLAPLSVKTIAQYFKEFGITPHKFGSSYVYAVYSTFKELDYNLIESDIEKLIAHYKKLFQPKEVSS